MTSYTERTKDLIDEYIAPSFDGDGDPHPIVETVLTYTLDELVEEPTEPTLDEATIRGADSMEDLLAAYQDEGLDIDDPVEAGRQATTDWWLETRDAYDGPTDTVKISYEDDETTYTLDVELLGFAHGQSNYFTLDDVVTDYLQETIGELIDEQDTVYIEQNLHQVIELDEGPIYEMQDHDFLEDTVLGHMAENDEDDNEPDEDTGPNPVLKQLEATVDRVTNALGARYDNPHLNELAAINHGLEDPEAIADVQRLSYATELPRDLQTDYNQAKFAEMKDDLHEWASETYDDDPETLMDELNNLGALAAHLDGAELIDKLADLTSTIGVGRSEYMSGFIVDDLLDPEVEQTALVIGAGHQPHIIDYLEELDDTTIDQFKEGTITGAWIDSFPRAKLETERHP